MKKVKDFCKNNKKLILISGLLLLCIIFLFIVIFKGKDEEVFENKTLKENIYVMYIKINPLIKLTFKESSECIIYDNGDNKCSESTNTVIGYEYINEDAKKIYNDLNLISKNILDAIILISKYAIDSDIDFDTLEITTNWDMKYSKEEILNGIKEKTKSSYELIIKINENDDIDEESILKDEGIKSFKVSFDTDGGSKVDEQTIVENSTAIKPINPKKDNYTFVEWQLNGKIYNFITPVTEDITLKAVWKKKEEKTTKENNNKESTTKSSNNTTTKEVETTTKSSETTTKKVETTTSKPVSKINLNENVNYYTSYDCAEYVYVNPECLNTPIRELKIKFPNYNKYLDEYYEELYQDCLINAQNPQEECTRYDYESEVVTLSEYSNYLQLTYFDECDNVSIPSSTLNTLKYGIKGVTIHQQNNSHVKFEYLRFKDSKYYSYTVQHPSFSKYGLLMDGGCGGGGGTPSYNVLDEATCEKFNLECDRW